SKRDWSSDVCSSDLDDLPCFVIRTCCECRVFFLELDKSCCHLVLVSFGFRFYRQVDNRLREFHGFQDDLVFLITECIPCTCILKTHRCSDIPCVNSRNLLTGVRVLLQDTPYTFTLVFCSIPDV